MDRSEVETLPLVLHTRVVTGSGGGPEKTILNSPRFLPPLGYRSICAYMRSPTDAGFSAIRKRAQTWNAPLIEVDDRGPFDVRIFREFLQICRSQKVAIWHGHDYKSNLIGLWVRQYWPMKLVTTAHGWVKFTARTPLYHAIDRYCQRYYDRVICVSDDLRTACVKNGVRPYRCVYIENAIDTLEFRRQFDVDSAKAKLGFDPQRRLIGAVGRLSEEKGFDVLIRAFARLQAELPDVDLFIAGDGDQHAALTRLIQELNLNHRVRLLGFRDDTKDLVQAFDAFALSSYREGLPNVVLEAMSLEASVVATAVNGVPRLVTANVDGLLVPAGDCEALANALRRLLNDRGFANDLARNARATIESRFSFHRRMEKVAALYNSVFRDSNPTQQAFTALSRNDRQAV